jgi:hypothetical protein
MVVNGTKKTLLLVRDLSDVIQVEKILKKKEEEAEKINLVKSEFSLAFSKLCHNVDHFVASGT